MLKQWMPHFAGCPYVNKKKMEVISIMANRFVLNETSYHGAGAVREIAAEAKGRGFQKRFLDLS